MPIYEYTCSACKTKFDQLVRKFSDADAKHKCPDCGSEKTARVFSVFATVSEGSKDTALPSQTPACGRCGSHGPCGGAH